MAISPRQFEEMQRRIANPKRVRRAHPRIRRPPVKPPPKSSSASIPPFAEQVGGSSAPPKPQPVALAHGTISCPSGWERSRCLARIAQTLRDILAQHRPTICAIEGLFYAQNLQTALIMGEARGAALSVLAEVRPRHLRNRPPESQTSHRRLWRRPKTRRRQNGPARTRIARTSCRRCRRRPRPCPRLLPRARCALRHLSSAKRI